MKGEPVSGEVMWLRMAGAREFIEDFLRHGAHLEDALEHVKLYYFLTEDQLEELREEYWRAAVDAEK